jgi:hypothetical protein
MANTAARDLFPGALEMTYQITASGFRHLEQQISSFERMFEGVTLVLNPSKSPAS